jgi:hypothetical protein
MEIEEGRADPPPGYIAAEKEFLNILQPVLRRRGRRDPLSLALDGFTHQASLRMIIKWNERLLAEPVTNRIIGVSLFGEDGWQRLDDVYQQIASWISEVAGRRSPLDWFGIMRRAAYPLHLRFPGTAGEMLHIVSYHCHLSQVPSSWVQFAAQGWRSGPSTLTDLDDLLSLSIFARNVRSVQRRVAKGQALTLADNFFPEKVEGDPEAARAIALFDSRRHVGLGENPGLSTGSTGTSLANPDSKNMAVKWLSIQGHRLLQPETQARLLAEYDPIVPFGLDLATLAPTAVFPESITKETCSLVAILKASWRWLEKYGGIWAKKRGPWTKYGYLACSTSWLRRELHEHESPIPGTTVTVNPQDVVEILGTGGLGVLYSAGHKTVIDLLGVSHLIDTTVARAQEGSAANIWGAAFESAIQNLIDGSPWRPPADLRPLIGKIVKRNGQAITDIDAVAFAQNTLILIDAKAFKVSAALARGEYSATLTMRERVEAASAAWRDRIALIRQDPSLLGVHIPDGAVIDGLVILPFVPYVHFGAATEPVLSLLRASSFSELIAISRFMAT